jgi:hypothetical protein
VGTLLATEEFKLKMKPDPADWWKGDADVAE